MLTQTTKQFFLLYSLCILLLGTGCVATPSATSPAPEPSTTSVGKMELPPTPQPLALFLDPSPAPGATPTPAPLTIRTRLVQINFDWLNGVIAPPGSPSQVKRLPLNLFGDASFIALPDRVDLNPKGMTVTGKLEGIVNSRMTLVVENQTLVGTVRVPGKLFQIRFAGNGLHAISEMDPKAFPPD